MPYVVIILIIVIIRVITIITIITIVIVNSNHEPKKVGTLKGLLESPYRNPTKGTFRPLKPRDSNILELRNIL